MNWLCREFEKTYEPIRVEKQTALSESDLEEALKTAAFIVVTAGGHVALGQAPRMTGKHYVPTPSDGSGLDPTRSNPY